MDNPSHVVTALIRNRAEIAGLIDHTQTLLRQQMIDLDNWTPRCACSYPT